MARAGAGQRTGHLRQGRLRQSDRVRQAPCAAEHRHHLHVRRSRLQPVRRREPGTGRRHPAHHRCLQKPRSANLLQPPRRPHPSRSARYLEFEAGDRRRLPVQPRSQSRRMAGGLRTARAGCRGLQEQAVLLFRDASGVLSPLRRRGQSGLYRNLDQRLRPGRRHGCLLPQLPCRRSPGSGRRPLRNCASGQSVRHGHEVRRRRTAG